MEEFKARRVVEALRERGVPAQLDRPSTYQFGVGVALPDGRLAVWGADSRASLAATVLRDGVLVGLVPTVGVGRVRRGRGGRRDRPDRLRRAGRAGPGRAGAGRAAAARPSLFQWRRDGFRYKG